MRVSRADVAEAWQALARSPEGKLALADLQHHFGFVERSTFPEDANVSRMAFNEGQRSVLLYLGRLLEMDAEAFRAREQGVSEGA